MALDRQGQLLPEGAIARIGNTRLRGAPNEVLFLAEDALVVAGRSVQWLDIPGAQCSSFAECHTERISCMARSADGRLFASGGEDTTIVLWDEGRVPVVHLRKHNNEGREILRTGQPPIMAVIGLCFAADGRELWSVHFNGVVCRWDCGSARLVQSFRLEKGGVCRFAGLPTSVIGCAALDDGSMIAFDLETSRQLWGVRAHDGLIGDLVASPKSCAFVSGGRRDGAVRVWEGKTGKSLGVLGGPPEGLSALAVSSDGGLLAVGGVFGPIELVRWDGVQRITEIPVLGELSRLAFSPDGDILACAVSGGVRCWHIPSGTEISRLEGPSFIQDMALSAESRMVALSEYQSVGLWDINTGHQRSQIKTTGFRLAFSPCGSLLAIAELDAPVRVWDTTRTDLVRSFDAQKWPRAIAFSPDGKFLASGTIGMSEEGASILVWDVTTGVLEGSSQSAPWPHGDEIAETFDAWDASCLAFSPDGKILASGGIEGGRMRRVRMWSVPNMQECGVLSGPPGFVHALAFSPDGHLIAAACDDKTIALWRLSRPFDWRSLAGHTARVTSVAFSPDSNRLASASDDKTVRIWDTDSGSLLTVLTGHTESVRKVIFDAAGNLFSASYDATVLIWGDIP